MAYSAFVLTHQARAHLLGLFPPKYPDVIAHHVTYAVGEKRLPQIDQINVVGHVDNEDGLECLLVKVNGKTQRPDGRTYHCTWSIDRSKGYKPVDSNEVIKQVPPDPVPSLPVSVTPEVVR